MWVVHLHSLEPLLKVLVVLLVNNSHFELTFVLHRQQLRQEPLELRLLLLASDDDADVNHIINAQFADVRITIYGSKSSVV